MDKLRAFIAIELPQEIQEKIYRFSESFKNPQDKISWVQSKNIHITLKFLGDIETNNIDSIENIIRDTAKKYSAFEITIKGTGVFPSERSPRVVWVGVSIGKEKVKDIYTDLEEKIVSIGIPKEERSFTPHITIGRIKYIKDINGFTGLLSKHKEDLFGNMKVNSISLMKSTLTPKGAVYEKLFGGSLMQ